MAVIGLILKSIIYAALVIGGAWFVHRQLKTRVKDPVGTSHRSQLLLLGIFLTTLIVLIIVLPFNDTLRGQLLSLLGILLSAIIALSSTTFVGNVMAGAMLRSIKCCAPGDYVHVGEYFGRISEMDLLHIEVQTEERDLVTLPNLYTVTNPMKVLRTSGTLVSTTLSLGYDVNRKTIEKNLLIAAEEAGLEKPFVHVKELGDFSVVYRVSGLLRDLGILLSTRSRLRGKVIDQLHNAGIEIVSPTFMNQKQYRTEKTFMPARVYEQHEELEDRDSDSMVFDKAAKAESLKELKQHLTQTTEAAKELEAQKKAAEKEPVKQELQERIDKLNHQAERWAQVIASREEKLQKED